MRWTKVKGQQLSWLSHLTFSCLMGADILYMLAAGLTTSIYVVDRCSSKIKRFLRFGLLISMHFRHFQGGVMGCPTSKHQGRY